MGGGGGGGDRDKLQAPKGKLPKLAMEQITPPAIVVRNEHPKLAVEPTVVVPPRSQAGGEHAESRQPDGCPVRPGLRPMAPAAVVALARVQEVASVPGPGPGVGPGRGGGIGGGVFHVGGGVSHRAR